MASLVAAGWFEAQKIISQQANNERQKDIRRQRFSRK